VPRATENLDLNKTNKPTTSTSKTGDSRLNANKILH